MIFLIFMLLFSFGLIKAISSIIGAQKRRTKALKKLEEFENKEPNKPKSAT